jgi:TctA family transporter
MHFKEVLPLLKVGAITYIITKRKRKTTALIIAVVISWKRSWGIHHAIIVVKDKADALVLRIIWTVLLRIRI